MAENIILHTKPSFFSLSSFSKIILRPSCNQTWRPTDPYPNHVTNFFIHLWSWSVIYSKKIGYLKVHTQPYSAAGLNVNYNFYNYISKFIIEWYHCESCTRWPWPTSARLKLHISIWLYCNINNISRSLKKARQNKGWQCELRIEASHKLLKAFKAFR